MKMEEKYSSQMSETGLVARGTDTEKHGEISKHFGVLNVM
jgi:hypothetical protein